MLAAANNNEKFFQFLMTQPGLQATRNTDIELTGALSAAITGNALNIVNLLLDAGVKPTKGLSYAEPPLIKALTADVYNPLILKTLLQHGADVNFSDNFHESPLIEAVRRDNVDAIIQLLADPNIDIDMYNDNGHTAFQEAAKIGNVEVLRLLVNAGANPNIKSEDNIGKHSIKNTVAGSSYVNSSVRTGLIKYGKDFNAAKTKASQEYAKRAMIQRRMTTGFKLPPKLKMPQKQLPQYIFGRAAYDELCLKLNKYNTRPQIQELARSLGITPGGLSKAALCDAIWKKLIL
jgi:hypothetical protein